MHSTLQNADSRQCLSIGSSANEQLISGGDRLFCPAPLAAPSWLGDRILRLYPAARQLAARVGTPAGQHQFLWVCLPCCRYFGAWRPGELNHSFMCAPIQPRGLSFHQLSFLTARRKGCGLCLELGGPLGNTPFQRSRLLESTARHCDLQVPAGPITPVRARFRLVGTGVPRRVFRKGPCYTDTPTCGKR
jgi:hypothetical protein